MAAAVAALLGALSIGATGCTAHVDGSTGTAAANDSTTGDAPSAATTVFHTLTGTYTIGADTTDASGRVFRYALVKTTAEATVTPAEYGWFLTPAYPQSTTVPLPGGMRDAELVETFVKHADADVYDPFFEQDGDTIAVMTLGSMVDIEVSVGHSVVPGGTVDPYYASGGQCLTLDTPAGPQKVTTGATYTFAYLLKEKTWVGN